MQVNDFICISDRAYSRDQILAKEKGILDKLKWNLTVPTPYVFLVRFLKAAKSDQEVIELINYIVAHLTLKNPPLPPLNWFISFQLEHMVFFFAELGLMQYSIVSYCPSMVAASAVYAARCTLNRSPLWNETLKRHTGFSEQQLMYARYRSSPNSVIDIHDQNRVGEEIRSSIPNSIFSVFVQGLREASGRIPLVGDGEQTEGGIQEILQP